MYKYQFTSTIKDLLDAEKADRSERSVHAPFRWIIILLGSAWLMIGIITLSHPNTKSVLWILLGVLTLYFFSIKPYVNRQRIRKSNSASQDITLEFDDNRLVIQIKNIGEFIRKWEELNGFVDTDKGFIFYFDDGVVNWLPNRVFVSDLDRKNFKEFLSSHQKQEKENTKLQAN
jgi:hypothetical protein